MAIYVTKKCPHCGYTYQFHQSGDQRQYGCPYRTCMQCMKSYWDTDIKEPALHGYKNLHEIKESIRRAVIILLYGPLGILLMGGGIYMLIEGEGIGLFLFAIGAFPIWAIGSYFKQKLNDKKHRDEIVAKQQSDYDESMERLKDISYLTALTEHDFLAKRLLTERKRGDMEHYAKRPQ